jgi:1-aminocyclopropane-1-carboxylate deaminase
MRQIALQNSPTERFRFRGLNFFLKRDDLLDRDFSGNKARKLYYFLNRDFPEVTQVISRGSIQSNAMFSIAVLAKLKGWKFIYYAHHIPKYLQQNRVGNLKEALNMGMELRERSFSCSSWQEFTSKSFGAESIIIDEGGREIFAREGVHILGREILEWSRDEPNFNKKIFLPSGTGTTASFLQEFFKKEGSSIEVFTTPCVGDESYLREQFSQLVADKTLHPKIVNSQRKYRFGKLYFEFYQIWLELQNSSRVEFELLYDPKGWIALFENIDLVGENSLYIHQGGLLGNLSMIPRYKREYPELGE